MSALAATHFYRYQTCEQLDRLERILFQNELYFPTAAQLNDPADCRPRIKYPSFWGTLRFLMRTWRRAHPDLIDHLDLSAITAVYEEEERG